MSSITVQRLLQIAVILCGTLCLRFTSASLVGTPPVVGDSLETDAFANGTENCPHTICLGIPHGHFINNPYSCAAFFQCLNGRAREGECPGGTWFNEPRQLCDAPWNVPCDAEVSEIIELECVTDSGPDYWISCEGRPGLHTIRHPFNCSSYYVCASGIPVHRSCAPGLEFNTETSQCMEPERANCSLDGCPTYNIPMTFIPSETSCSQFSVCYYGEPIPHSCAVGLYWSQEEQWCTFPDLANCTIETTTTEPTETTDDWTTTELPDITTTDMSEITIECRDDSPLFNPHPTDCTLYVLCGPEPGQDPVIVACAAGLYFDTITRQCTLRSLATCYPGSG